MAAQNSRFVRGAEDNPPPVHARFFYTSPYAIDDPLSPLPPPVTATSPSLKHPPRPFSTFDHKALEEAWHRLRKEIREVTGIDDVEITDKNQAKEPRREQSTQPAREIPRPQGQDGRQRAGTAGRSSTPSSSLREGRGSLETGSITRNPFVRAPSRKQATSVGNERSEPRPPVQAMDSYDWDDEFHRQEQLLTKEPSVEKPTGPSAKIPVGISRLHSVVMPQLAMEPIYWSPLNDVAPIVRATWFYKDTLFPVEPDVANMLEAGYTAMRPWTETWRDELNSAVEVGALGEMKIMHRLWPQKAKKPPSRPGTSQGWDSSSSMLGTIEEEDPEKEKQTTVATAMAIIDSAAGTQDNDNKASGQSPFGRDGHKREYLQAGVMYANATEAYLLRPNLQPSDYYGRRPYSNYIRKGRKIGVAVVRGFDQATWNRLHPQRRPKIAAKAQEGISSAEAGVPPRQRQKLDPDFELSEHPKVTDLVLVIHGIGQKLSERVESYNFTYAMNAFRREVAVELGVDAVKAQLRKDMGGIMVLPVNWRLGLSFEDGGYRDHSEDSGLNHYSLKDITPATLPSVRGIVSDVMLDIPYYLSQEHNPKMVSACIKEANRIYRLWCANNPGFNEYGQVHLIAHSLGSVMAFDILSNQPTYVDRRLSDPAVPESELPQDQFLFDTSTLVTAGSPVGFFLLLKRANLLPRKGRQKPGLDDLTTNTPGVTGERGMYGCLPIHNIYNIINPYDPVAYRLNAAFDAAYSNSLKQAILPSATKPWTISNPFAHATPDALISPRPLVPRLPSNVELETHNFTREEIAEERAFLLNDNGQVDYFMRYGGGPLEIQYLTMLGAHSSYWISRDFVRFIVTEIGRKPGREGTLPAMRAQKKKIRI